MNYEILGPIGLHTEHGHPIEPPTGRPAKLLVALALRAGEQLPLEPLVDLLWEAGPPRSYRANLQTYVSRLRRIGLPVVWSAGGYRLHAEPAVVDAHRLVSQVDDGSRAAAAGDHAAALRVFQQAVALVRGLPFAGTDPGPFGVDVARLAETHLLALERLTDAELAAGRLDPAITRLQGLVVEFPLRETLWCRLMTALTRAGRSAEALAAYHRARVEIVEALGVEPGSHLRREYAALLQGNG